MVLLPNISFDFLVGCLGLSGSSVQLIQIQVDLYGVVWLLLGQKDNRLHVARLDMQNVFAIFPFKGTSPQPF